MLPNALTSLLLEPRAPLLTPRVWWDRALVAVLVPTAIVEGVLREDLVWRPLAIGLGVALLFTILWRRTRSFLAFVLTWGVVHAVSLLAHVADVEWTGLYSGAFLLLLIYSLFRWGAGREAALGLVLMAGGHSVSILGGQVADAGEAVAGLVVILFPAALGTAVRFRARSQLRELDQAKTKERESLARELHDSVAHHVSAIVIQAQAGRAVAGTRPEAAVEALEVIEKEAARTLAEMRGIVAALRDDEAAELAPQSGVADLERLARGASEQHVVDVELSGDLDALPAPIDAAIYRLAQESITNAVRHARNARRVQVSVEGDGDVVRLTVIDDGEAPAHATTGASGFGLVGMAERVAILGGTFEAGAMATGGWRVEAVLPRAGPPGNQAAP